MRVFGLQAGFARLAKYSRNHTEELSEKALLKWQVLELLRRTRNVALVCEHYRISRTVPPSMQLPRDYNSAPLSVSATTRSMNASGVISPAMNRGRLAVTELFRNGRAGLCHSGGVSSATAENTSPIR